MKSVILLIALFGALFVSAQTMKCTAQVGKYFYNLTGLYHSPTATDLSFGPIASGDTFYINMCGQTATGAATTCAAQSVCQKAKNGYYYGCGATVNQRILASNASGVQPGKGVMVIYSGGQACSGGPTRSTIVYVNCNPTANPGFITGATEGDCTYTLTMDSALGCGKSGGGGDGGKGSSTDVGAILLIILLVLVVVYFAGGAVYQWKFKGASRPVEFMVHNEFWLSLPLLIKDGACFIRHGFKKGDYTSV